MKTTKQYAHLRQGGIIVGLLVLAAALRAGASGTTEYAGFGTQRLVDKPAAVGDPVSAASGAFSWQKTLIPLGGPMGLDFSIHYRTDPNATYLRSPSDFPPGYYFDNSTPFLLAWSWQPAPLLLGNSFYDMTVLLDDGGQVCFMTNEAGDFVFAEIPEISGGVDRNFQLKRMDNWFYFCDPTRGRVTMFQLPEGTGTLFYRPETILDRNSNRLTYAYLTKFECNPRSIADDAGRALYFGYETYQNQYEWVWDYRFSAVTDHVGRTWTFLYETNAADNGGRITLRGVVEPGGRTNRFLYRPNNLYYGSGNISSQLCLLVSATLPCGNATFSNEYATSKLPDVDRHVRCIAQSDAFGNRTTLAVTTEVGRYVGNVTNPDGTTNQFVHDGHHDVPPRQVTDGAGQTMAFERNAVGYFRSATDRGGATTRFGYDATGRLLTGVTNALGEAAAIVWETAEQTFVNPATNHAVTFSFDQIARIEYPDGTSEQYAYDGQGNVTARTDRAGAVWTTVRDDRGRPVQSVRPGGGTVARTYATNGLLLAVADSDGFAESYGYDELFRLTFVTNAVGGVRQYAYDEAGNLVRIVDELGGETVVGYDANGNPTNVVDPAGYVLSREYDAMDRVAAISDAAGSLETRTYDALGRLAESATPAATNVFGYHPNGWTTNAATGARAWAWRHDADGRITNVVAPDGGVAAIARDALGRPVAATDPLGQITAIAYDAAGRIAAVTNPLGAATRFAYDGAGRLLAVTNALGGVFAREYDADGHLVAATDPDGHPTGWSYTPMGRLRAVSNALGEIVHLAYDAQGRLAAVTNADGTATAWNYDAAGRVVAFTDEATNAWRFARDTRGAVVAATNPAGGATAYAYNPDGTLQTATDGETGLVSNRYDAARRLVETVYPDGSRVRYDYDEHGEVVAATDALGGTNRFAYDAAGRLASVVDALGQAATFAYDAAGRLTNVVDRAGAATSWEYDAAGQLVAATDATGVRRTWARDLLGRATNVAVGTSVWQIAYNASGVATQLVAPSGRATAIVPDALGRIAQTVDPLGRTNAVAYDARGRIASATDPAGRATHYAADPRGLPAGIALPDGTAVAYAWNAAGQLAEISDGNEAVWTLGYSPMGRLRTLTDPLARTNRYAYDVNGRLAAVTNADGTAAAYEYDANGWLARLAHSAGPELAFQRDALGRITNSPGLTLAYDAEGRVTAAESAGVAFGAAYDAAGRLATATYADGAFAVTYTYAVGPNGDGRLTRVGDSLTGTQVDFAYDADGRLATVALPNGETIAYTWDDAGRLTRLQSGDHVDAQRTYDLAGQVVQTVLAAPLPASGGLAAATNVLAFDAASQIASAGFVHDARGRVAQIPAPWHPGGAALAWDGASRLTNANGAALAYDGFGNVQTRAAIGATNRFFHHPAIGGAPIVAEQDVASGAFRRYYVWTPGGRLLYLIDATDGHAVRFYHFDPNGNALALTDTNRAVTDAWAYDPYGRILARTGTSPQPFTFCGAWGVRQDGADGLYQMRARWYHARLTRFLSPEPLWPQLGNPKALNPYQYAGADPVRFADPSGQFFTLGLLNGEDLRERTGEFLTQMIFNAALEGYEEAGLVGMVQGIQELGLLQNVDLIHADEGLRNDLLSLLQEVQQAKIARFQNEKRRRQKAFPPAPNPRLSTARLMVDSNSAPQFRLLQSQQQSAEWFSSPPSPAPEGYRGDGGPLPARMPPAPMAVSVPMPVPIPVLAPAPVPLAEPAPKEIDMKLLGVVSSGVPPKVVGNLPAPLKENPPQEHANALLFPTGGYDGQSGMQAPAPPPLWQQAWKAHSERRKERFGIDFEMEQEATRQTAEQRQQEIGQMLNELMERPDLTDEQKQATGLAILFGGF